MNSLDRLTGFYWVARARGYARAARAFPYPITEPGVHQQVRRLEEELGVRLFERVGKDRVVPTEAGRALYAFVAPFLEQLPAVTASLRAGSFGGTLRVGAPGLLVQGLLPGWLRRLQRLRPDIEVALTELKTADLDLLRSGELDLLVDYLLHVPADIEARAVARLWTFLALPAGHPQATRRPISVRALRDVPFVAYNVDRAGRALQLQGLAAHGGPDRERYSADSTESLLGFVAAGLGFSLVPSLDPRGPRRAGVVVERLRGAGTELTVYAARRRGPHHPLVEAALSAAPVPGS
ncbi:MAG TPA: LysR substrate-binding domain-containing protein [Myxococcaceae bacterium]|nr:LysR substrate-binding domain-containing protein [Myxococcaceae bacterium]